MDTELSELIKYKKEFGKDNIHYKEIIKQKLMNNRKLLVALDADGLDPDEDPDAYVGTHLIPYYVLPDVKTEAQNLVCFETAFTEVPRYNETRRYMQIIFYILCDPKNIYDRNTGIARHDLIAAIIEDEFNYCNDFGYQLTIVSDRPYAVDSNKYVLRTLTFEQIDIHNMLRDGALYNK